ncbi:nuclease [Bacillus sp. M6-12]|uniref:nuclease-related domain-containing protein n=1 Tax=Bacillus sp. M6-12 TaxID=2054166 RepID=UPI000C756816|nr:nuclease-related domain-containing protein [Bacillus sp. M6-12]PLS17984.1 nuclease [Bacillus sp. M6-12]
MIVKNLEISIYQKKLRALLRRLPRTHSKRDKIEEALARSMAGYNGEKAVDFYLRELPEQEYFILHDLRLADKDQLFQLDLLILSAKFFLIIEVKNISGSVYFDSLFNQFIRKTKGSEKAFPNPLLQIRRQQEHLGNWLEKLGQTKIPIETLVVISNPYTVIKSDIRHHSAINKVINCENLTDKIKLIQTKFTKDILTIKELRRISRQAVKQDTPFSPDILEKFHISATELLTGVHCPSCQSLPMVKKASNWICPECKHISKEAHLEALSDYCLLRGSTITNNEIKHFLKLSSASTATKMLSSLDLFFTGNT